MKSKLALIALVVASNGCVVISGVSDPEVADTSVVDDSSIDDSTIDAGRDTATSDGDASKDGDATIDTNDAFGAHDANETSPDAADSAPEASDSSSDVGETCVPITSCPSGKVCGNYDNGCGGSINCGTCTTGTCDTSTNTCKCTPATTCASGHVCGTDPDGCGGTVNCGTCGSGLTCNTTTDTCVSTCTPLTTCPTGACGTIDNGCGTGTLTCGGCGTGFTCDSSSHTCKCVPATTCPTGQNCGTASDGCGGSIPCGTCGTGFTCNASNVCVCATTSCPSGDNCGTIPDGCGGSVRCGPDTCSGTGATCGGGGTANVCGCTPSWSCTGKCGAITDNCGGAHDCGGCTAPDTCGGGGTANVCGCTPLTKSAACGAAVCGTVGDGCTGNYSCGTCAAECISGGCVNAVEIRAGGDHICARLSNGTVWCWGSNAKGQLGDGTVVERNAPVQVGGITSAVALALGDAHTCVLLSDATVRCWGFNGSGQLGDGTTTDRHSPVAVTGLTGVSEIGASIGANHTCARLGGFVKCWGDNTYGQLGDGTTTNRSSPVDVEKSAGVRFSGVDGLAIGGLHSALIASGFVYCWGFDGLNDCGDGAFTTSIPYPKVVIGGQATVASGEVSSCSTDSGGNVHCWGMQPDASGNDGTPAAVAAFSGATAISIGNDDRCARFASGIVKCAGGYPGNGTTGSGNTVITVSGVSSASGVARGGDAVCVLVNGGIQCWGPNSFGAVGDNSTTARTTPVAVAWP